VLNNRNVTEIKVKLNQIYKDYYQSSLLFMLNQTDFDDNETIEYCLVLLQMNLKNQSCTFSIHDIFIDLLTYIDYDIETMFNWLLSPETEHYFLVLLLKLCKYFAINNNHKQLQLVTVYERTMITMKQFYEKLNNAQQKQLFPYDIKPLLNVFKITYVLNLLISLIKQKYFSKMGRVFLEHLGGQRVFSCGNCDAPLTNRNELVSTRFTGATGRAFLFSHVVNIKNSPVQERMMLTGRHFVRDVACKKCETKLGWMYEFATEESQRYKEGRVILERALITECDGF
ncbi:unnamed protein product, partial [Didymodactylos carnosus]